MGLPRFFSVSSLSLAGVVLLIGGLGIALFASQQQQDNRSQAAAVSRPSVPSSITSEKSSQTSLGPCYSGSSGSDRYGAMCESDGGSQYSSVSEAQALSVCPGGYVGTNARNGATSSNTWYCPGGNEYRCCKNAAPTDITAKADPSTITLTSSTATGQVALSGSARDPDAGSQHRNQYGSDERWRSTLDYTWVRVSGPTSPSFPSHEDSATATATGLKEGTYKFKLRVSDGYQTRESGEVTVNVNAPDNEAPTTPTNLTAQAVSTTQINLSWTASTDDNAVTGYKVFRGGTEIAQVTGTTYQNTGLTPNTTYTYTVKAVDAQGSVSQASNEASATTGSNTTTFRLNLMIHGIGDGKFDGEDPNIAWGGEDPIPSKQERDVKVEVYEITGQGLGAKVAEGTGKVKYETGGYKSVAVIGMGSTLITKNYYIRIISGPAIRTDSRAIQQGLENTITMTLKNGDANLDKNLSLIDYNLIYNCVKDELVGKIPTTTQCSNANKEKADIDDDGEVTWFDYNLVVRELTNQSL